MLFSKKQDAVQAPAPEEDAPEKTGPARFWELVKDELAAVLVANLLFLAACIPVVTLPPALFSLHMLMGKIIAGEGVPSCAKDFFAAFRQGGKRAYGAFFLTAAPMGIAGYGAVFYLGRAADFPVLLLPFALCAAVFWVAMLASTYLYGLLCGGRTLGEAARTALLLSVGKPLRGFLAALCCYGTLLLAVLFFPLSGLYLFLLGFSLPCLLGHFIIRTVLEQYCGGQGG